MEEGIHCKQPLSNLQLLLPEPSTTSSSTSVHEPSCLWFPSLPSILHCGLGTAGACQQVPVCVSCRDMFSSPAWPIGSCPNSALPHQQPTAQGSAKKDQSQHVWACLWACLSLCRAEISLTPRKDLRTFSWVFPGVCCVLCSQTCLVFNWQWLWTSTHRKVCGCRWAVGVLG